ncbi:hypothetical protein [Streptomyces sp. NBC_01565]|uniref:hypothetical protein n=1 Tax=unclassified Streptomyces TaxID=2593676 RepID=UPI0022544642|nr:hypothetical protein [Streptomyces sp. NBC_01565]MCX4546436.1 hypothetical protein [Streptomyces sp. NBC_01565]
MTAPSTPPRRNWPYVVVAIVVLALQQGWNAQQITTLAVSLLVLIAVITAASNNRE